MNQQQPLLTDRIAIVTGSAEGIGKAIAQCLAAFGAHVVVPDINEAEAEKTAVEIRALGRRAIALKCDVTKQEDVDRMMSSTMREFGRVDILVNNVGDTIRKLFTETTEEEWYSVINLNLIQVFRCTQAVAKVMIDQEIQGSIINITTVEAYRAAPGHAIYAAAKAGLASFTKTMALELSPWGIRVNSIAPDTTITAGKVRRWRKHGQDLLGKAQYTHAHIPLNRPGTPEDSGGAAIFLASDLSKWITGEVIHVGGGTHAASGWVRTESGHWSTGGPPQAYSGKPLNPIP